MDGRSPPSPPVMPLGVPGLSDGLYESQNTNGAARTPGSSPLSVPCIDESALTGNPETTAWLDDMLAIIGENDDEASSSNKTNRSGVSGSSERTRAVPQSRTTAAPVIRKSPPMHLSTVSASPSLSNMSFPGNVKSVSSSRVTDLSSITNELSGMDISGEGTRTNMLPSIQEYSQTLPDNSPPPSGSNKMHLSVDEDPMSVSDLRTPEVGRSDTTLSSVGTYKEKTEYKLMDAREDPGTYTGSCKLTNQWRRGMPRNKKYLPSGKGKMKYDSRKQYDGHWESGRWEGEGVETLANGEGVREGTFSHFKLNGLGFFKHRRGWTLCAHWQEGTCQDCLSLSGLDKSNYESARKWATNQPDKRACRFVLAHILRYACECGNSDLVESVVEQNDGAKDQKVDGEYLPLDIAILRGHNEIADYLRLRMNPHAPPIDESAGPLHWAAALGRKHVVDRLFQAETHPDVNSTTRHGWTPLHYSCVNGNYDIVCQLLYHHAHRNETTDDGETPLHCASRAGHTEIVRMLVLCGADVHSTNNDHWTPLHFACQNGSLGVVQCLLEKDADVNAGEHFGRRTPLHVACENEHLSVVRCLVKNGASINARTDLNKTPLSELHWSMASAVREFLRSEGGIL